MLERFLRFLRGYVVFEILGNFPERFINLCMQRGVGLFEISPEDDGFFASMLLADYKRIRPIARRGRVRLRARRRMGVPFILHRYKSRKGLVVGFAMFIIISLVMQNFIWTLELRGVETLSVSKVYQVLEEEGFGAGAFKPTMDLTAVERRLMQEFPEIGWMSINLIGTRAEIEIKEKAVKPVIPDYKTPHNVVAAHDGLIESIITKQGTATTQKGSAVVEGQLLVSSAMVSILDEIRYVHAEAEVMARTTRNMKCTLPRQIDYKSPGEPVYRNSLIFCFVTFPVSFQSVSGEYTVEEIREKLNFNDTFVEVGVKKDKIIPYENKTREITREKADEILKAEDYLHRFFSLSQAEEILAEWNITEVQNGYELNVTYTCLEDIAVEEVFIVNSDGI